MIHTTKGIVLHHFKYSENSIIAKIYTQKFGLQSYIINGVRNKKSKNKAVYLQVLSLVEINTFYKEKNGLQGVKSIQLDIPFTSIPFDINKSSIAFFIAEILTKSIKEEEANPKLFSFLHNTIQLLDLEKKKYANFHLLFLAHLTKYLGVQPQTIDSTSPSSLYFDLQEGIFTSFQPSHQAFISSPISTDFLTVLGTNFDAIESLNFNAKQRKLLLSAFVDYYRLHLSNFGKLKSITILEEVLN